MLWKIILKKQLKRGISPEVAKEYTQGMTRSVGVNSRIRLVISMANYDADEDQHTGYDGTSGHPEDENFVIN